MNRIAYILIPLLLSLGSFSTLRSTAIEEEIIQSSSFENDLDGWSIKATDVWGDPPEAWSITRSQDMAKDGNTSLKLFLANSNDAEKIWIEKSFAVEPNGIYQVTVEYALASVIPEQSADFTIITGVLANSPNTREDLRPAYKDEANNGTSEVGYKWRDRLYDFTVRSHEHGMLYVVIGIWGTWEVRQKYYLDALQVTVTKKPDSAKFYSFESDLEGWTANASDTGLGTESSDWFISRMQEVPLGGEDGEYSIHFDLNNLTHNGKIWMERAFSVEPRRKYKVDLDYAFHHAYCAGPPPKFNIIAGVFRRHPESGEDILDAVREKTGVTKCLWGWMQKSYSFTIKSKKSDTLYAVIGIWDKDEAHRTYNVDSVCITITPK